MEIIFIGKCIDPEYKWEEYYLKEISGHGIKNTPYTFNGNAENECYIYCDEVQDWLLVDFESVVEIYG